MKPSPHSVRPSACPTVNVRDDVEGKRADAEHRNIIDPFSRAHYQHKYCTYEDKDAHTENDVAGNPDIMSEAHYLLSQVNSGRQSVTTAQYTSVIGGGPLRRRPHDLDSRAALLISGRQDHVDAEERLGAVRKNGYEAATAAT
jgi:hypothetical protein